MKQVFSLDIESGDVIQITNLDIIFINVQALSPIELYVNAITEDTNGDGVLNELDNSAL